MTDLTYTSVFSDGHVRPLPGARAAMTGTEAEGREAFIRLFDESFAALHRYLNRSSGDPELASELAQEAFVRLYRRRSPPDDPHAWLFTVATNLLRNAKSKQARRARLLTRERGLGAHSEPGRAPDAASGSVETRRRVRRAMDSLTDRDRSLLLLFAEGHSYKEMATIVGLKETSVGTLLRRAKESFRAAYSEVVDAR
jgi:RNA polymerase sigma-70 factor (ECF subfamily)